METVRKGISPWLHRCQGSNSKDVPEGQTEINQTGGGEKGGRHFQPKWSKDVGNHYSPAKNRQTMALNKTVKNYLDYQCFRSIKDKQPI